MSLDTAILIPSYNSNAQLDELIDQIKAKIDEFAYQSKREKEYPSIIDQLDDIYHNGIDGWKATIKVTKDKYPKE